MTYSSSLAMSRRRFASRHQNAVSFQEKTKTIGPVSNTIILVVLSCLLGLLYLTQVTKTNSNGYVLNDLQTKQSELQKEHDDLELTSARLQSLDRVASSQPNQALVSVAPSATVQ